MKARATLFGLFLMSAGAFAEEPRAFNYECDTPAGHFSYWNGTVSGGEIEISGKVTVNDLLKDKKWSPGASITLRDKKERPSRFGIRVYAVMKTPDLVFLELLKVGGHEAIGLGLIPRTKKPIPFTLRLDATGLLKATIAGADASTNLGDFKAASFELGCSTGDFEFTDVTVTEK